nr:reverse transcriptase domain-containing protein [Tanacetum cinerariifolium]
MGIKGIAKVARGWFLGCDLSLDCREDQQDFNLPEKIFSLELILLTKSWTDAKLQEERLPKPTEVRAKAGQVHPPYKKTKEILVLDKVKFKPPSPMTTPIEKRTLANFKVVTFNQRIEATQWERPDKGSKKGGNLRKGQAAGNTDGTTMTKDTKQRITQTFSHEGSSLEILYEHCFNRFRPEMKSQMVPVATPLVGFSGEIIWPLGQLSLLMKIGDEENSISSWMNFMVVSDWRNGHITEQQYYSTRMHNGLRTRNTTARNRSSHRIKDSGSNSQEQTIAIGSTLTEQERKELCWLLRCNIDIFAWKPANMNGVPHHIAEHRLNIRKGLMVKKHDGSWRMCVDFKDLNKACPKDGYSLPKIDWKEDEEKTAFITSQEIFCYSKMPFGLKNDGATYQRLVGKAFQKQIGKNLEVYVDDLVIKSRTEQEVIRDIEEMFKTLREINMKLNPKKCTFGMREGMFMGYKVNADGLKVCLAKLPMLTASKEKKELVIYLVAAKEAISVVLMTEKDGKQMPKYFVSRALQGPEFNYTPMEKLILALGLILVDFIVKRLEDDSSNTPMEDKEELSDS